MDDTQTAQFGTVFGDLLSQPRTMPLGPGEPASSLTEKLGSLSVENAFAGRNVVDKQMAEAAVAGVLLYHDHFDASHAISQAIHTPTGSYWHGILHRREPDYPNAKYWFSKAGDHPVFEPLYQDALVLASQSADARTSDLQREGRWNPATFVDLCQQAADPASERLRDICLKIQMREWWLLFEYSYTNALGQTPSRP
ncbi:MAG: hypothetical protein WD294_16575 [Phycisphaeraceae bacterium]